MNIDELFTRAVALLPGTVRERLDGDFPVDWTVLEDAATGAELGKAVRARHRLPKAVEVLVSRLIRDVGIVPADVAAGAERQGAATAWIHWVTIEADGESYHLRNDRSGDVRTDVRPEAVAGYATLGMDLATAMHDTVERWTEAGEQHRATAEDEEGTHCTVLGANARAPSDTARHHLGGTNGGEPRAHPRVCLEHPEFRRTGGARGESAQHRPRGACAAQELLRSGDRPPPACVRHR